MERCNTLLRTSGPLTILGSLPLSILPICAVYEDHVTARVVYGRDSVSGNRRCNTYNRHVHIDVAAATPAASAGGGICGPCHWGCSACKLLGQRTCRAMRVLPVPGGP